MPCSKNSKRPLPLFLARYIATSAARRIVSARSMFERRSTAMPTLAEIMISRSSMITGDFEAVLDPLRDGDGVLAVDSALEQHGELVTAETGDQVVGAHAALESRGDGDEQLVTDVVAEAVVDELEVVEVDEQHRDDTVLALVDERSRRARRRGRGWPGR